MTPPFTLAIGCQLRFHPRGEGVLMLQLEGARYSGQAIRNEFLDISGAGRDATDVSFATIYGDITPTAPTVIARLEPAPPPTATLPATPQAVSFSAR